MGAYYTDGLNGSDLNTGLSEVQAFATIQKGCDTASAGDTLYVEATQSYTEEVTAANTGDGTSGRFMVEGYSSTPGDGGQITIDGQSTRTQCLIASGHYQVFKNIRFTGATGDGVNGSGLYTVFENCRADNNGAHGFDMNYLICRDCQADANTFYGWDSGIMLLARCKAFDNGRDQFRVTTGGTYIDCLAYGLANSSSWGGFDGTGTGFLVSLQGCVVDGEGGASSTAYKFQGATVPGCTLTNCIAFDCNEGYVAMTPTAERAGIARDACAACSCTTDSTNWAESNDFVTIAGDPFTDSGSRDYTLDPVNGALLIGAAYDGSGVPVPGFDIGAFQTSPPAGGRNVMI